MPRRKSLPTADDAIAAIPELSDDEQFVSETTTKRTVRKEKVATPEKGLPIIDIEEVDDEDDDDDSAFPDNSMAALWYGNDGDLADNPYCSVHVKRNPDSLGDIFLHPSSSVQKLAPIRNIDINTGRDEIEERIRQQYGGGNYYFQIFHEGRLGKGWSATLADSPDAVAKAKAEKEASLNPAPPTPVPVNPFDQFFDTLRKQKEMRDLLFGDEQKRLETEIERLRRENESRPTPQPVNQSDLALLLSAMKETNNPGLVDFAREYLSPENREPSFGGWDFLKYIFDNKEQVAGLAQMVLGGLLPSAPSGPQGIEALLKQTPPNTGSSVTRSNFQRRPRNVDLDVIEGEPVIDNDIDSDNAGLEASQTENDELND